MTTALPGDDVRRIRNALGLSVIQFATVLGVHPSTVHRWEAAKKSPVPIEGVAWTVMSALRERVLVERAARAKVIQAGQDVSSKLAAGGVLLALAALLYFAAGKSK